MNPPGQAASLKQLFVDVGCFEKICEVLSIVKEEAQKVKKWLGAPDLHCSAVLLFAGSYMYT